MWGSVFFFFGLASFWCNVYCVKEFGVNESWARTKPPGGRASADSLLLTPLEYKLGLCGTRHGALPVCGFGEHHHLPALTLLSHIGALSASPLSGAAAPLDLRKSGLRGRGCSRVPRPSLSIQGRLSYRASRGHLMGAGSAWA